MNITVNQTPHIVTDNLSVKELLIYLDIKQQKGIAVAVGMQIIQQDQWDITRIKDNQTINIITASQGG